MTDFLPAKLVIPVGLPGCGKSTFAQNVFFNNMVIVSTDEIRAGLGDVNAQDKNKQVFESFHKQIDANLGHGSDVYADATNLDVRSRNELRDIALRNRAEVHVLLFTNVKEAIIRNSQRSRRVPDDVMLRFIYKLEECLKVVPHEPITSITRIDGVQGTSAYATHL